MAFLADDERQGRATGSSGFDAAARYIAEQLTSLGVPPPQGTYRQEFAIQQKRVVEDRTSLTITRGQTRNELAYGRDFVSYGRTATEDIALNDEVVFVGDGITVDSRGIDSYRRVSAGGKIVVALAGTAPGLKGSEAGFFADAETKAANAADHGASALLLVEEEYIPWELRVRAARQLGTSEWLPSHADKRLKAIVYISRPAAERLLRGSLKQRRPALGTVLGSASLRITTEARELKASNVWGVIKGSDPVLASEYIVMTAHLDHLGMDTSMTGDAIYNGAVDNASGVAGLLTIAKAFAALPTRPARSVLFLATAGEELGEIGSDYFVQHSPTSDGRIVAMFNLDGLSFVPFQRLVAGGASDSTLGAMVDDAGKRLGIGIKHEPLDIEGSDHAPFLKNAIPALWIQAALSDRWMATRYHTVADDMGQPLDFSAAVQHVRLVFLTGYLTAQRALRPAWNRAR
jgi:hypothetical protein